MSARQRDFTYNTPIPRSCGTITIYRAVYVSMHEKNLVVTSFQLPRDLVTA